MIGATLTFLGDGVILAIGVIALVWVGAAELLRPDMPDDLADVFPVRPSRGSAR